VLTERISHILTDKSGKAESIMAITFTNKAAKELLDRIKKVTNDADEMWVGTFHSICIRLLRMFGDEIGLDDFTILDTYNSKKVATEVLTNLGAVVSKSTLNNYLSRVVI
jgi:DNA helicase-2/ATP-dependent DNA helicase PcrA